MHRLSVLIPKNALFLSLGLFLLALAGCGSTSTSTASTVSSASATATACVQVTRPAAAFKTTTGVLKSINGQTLVVTNNKGNDVTITYSTTTRFTQANIVAAASLQEGTSVRVAVTSNNGSYSATSITVTTRANGNGTGTGNGFPRGNGTPGANRGANNPCVAVRRGGQNPGAGNGTGTGTPAFRGLVGTVSQLNGTTLTITETTGSSFTVTITPQTQIIETQAATATALKVGVRLTVVGGADSQGTIAANTIAILPPNILNPATTPAG
ncbi:MAG: DUF5666 domain-containing protein [Ktedonobacteraceae bacterium]